MKPIETLLRSFVEIHPDDAARAYETLAPKDQVKLFKGLSTRLAVTLLERTSPQIAAPLLADLDPSRSSELLREMSPRVASSILHQFDESHRDRLLQSMPEHLARQLRELSRYSGETAGAIMEPRVASLSNDLTVGQAITAIRKTPREALHYLYVTRRDGTLTGVLTMRDLLLGSPRDPIEPLIRKDVVSVADTMESDAVVQMMTDRGFLAMPVVDFEGRLVGVVRHAEALHAGQEAAFEDLQRIVGAGPDERALSPVSMVIKSRLPWLYVNLVTAFMAAAVIGVFEGTIEKVAALAVLLPVVAGQGGNTGAQSLAVVMRGLALREIIPGVKGRMITKELVGGIINGIAVALVTAVAVFAWRAMSGDSAEAGLGLALVIGLAMVVNMAAAAMAGSVIPLILKSLGRDPAQSAAIFLTTVTDIVGFAAFLGFATLFMGLIA